MAPSKTSDPLVKYYEKVVDLETGVESIVPVRYMNEEEIKEREALYIANTASALRARVVEQLSGQNGHSNGSIAEPE